MRNNNQKVITRLSDRSLRSSRMRNAFAAGAIALTCILFTVLASMGIGMMQITQEQTMREVGGRFHAGLKGVTQEEMDKITADSRVKDFSWNILVGTADNILKRSGEIRYAPDTKELENSFITLKEGQMPQKEEDIIVDTFILDELKLPYKLGEQIPLTFSFQGEQIEKTFTLCGWYEGDGVSHASQIYISEAYWNELKGDWTPEDFKAWEKIHPNDANVGLYSAGLYFKSARNIEDTIRSIITDAGYEPDTQVAYGVNWAYMQNRTEQTDPMTLLMLTGALIVIIFTGYLIISNIFQISIMQDIRFYALLKTIGTTKKQIRRLVRRQALLLSLAGIPAGLAVGYGISKVLFPIALNMLDMKGMKIVLHFHPAILIFAAGFSLLTVAVSCRKPGKIAGSVSPVEAVRYTEGSIKRKKSKKTEKGAKLHAMALSNLGRNKKKTVFVIASMSLSVVLLCIVLTALGSFQIDGYLKSRLVGDVTIGSINYTSSLRDGDFSVDPDYVEIMDSQPGIRSKGEMWTTFGNESVYLGEKQLEKYRSYDKEGILRRTEEFYSVQIDRYLSEGILPGARYAYDEVLMKNLKVLEGELDLEKFQQGGYVLVTPLTGDDTESHYLYEPGDKVKLGFAPEDSQATELKDSNGEVIDYVFDEQQVREYEVMAVVDIPFALDTHMYSVNSVDFVLNLEDLKENARRPMCFALSYELEDDAVKNFKDIAQDYTENVNSYMGYVSKEQLEGEFSGMLNSIGALGIAMSGVIAFIGILNFMNSTLTGIFSRKQEFAILSSIGMTQKQLKRMLLEEGLYYVLIASGISILLGTVLSWAVLSALNQVILFFDYQFNPWAFVIMIPLFAVIACVVPYRGFAHASKESIVERLRDTQG